MLLLGKQLQGLTVVGLSTGQQIGQTGRPVIDWHNLAIPALVMQPSNLLLMTNDIREFGRQAVLINSEDDLIEPSDVIRLKPLLERNFQLTGAKVKTEAGQSLGQVGDFTFNPKTFMVQKIHVKQPLLKSFITESLIIDRDQIVEINPPLIIVRDATLKEPLVAAAVVPE